MYPRSFWMAVFCLFAALTTSAQQITVTQPNGGEVWAAGTDHYIRWNFEGGEGATVTVQLLKANVVVQTLSTNTPTSQGYFDWTVGAVAAGGGYTVRVTSNAHPMYTDDSNGPFTIQSGSLQVAFPNANDIAARGLPSQIAWTYTGNPGTVKIDLYKGGVFNSTIAAAAPLGTGGAGSFSWTPSAQLPFGTDYSLLLTSTADATIQAQSNGPFKIDPGSIKVTSPHGGETWIYGWCYDFTWTYAGSVSSTVNLRIVDTLVAGLGSHLITGIPIGNNGTGVYHQCFTPDGWSIGYETHYKFQVTDSSNADISAMSANNFALQAGSLRVTSPNGGEVWTRGTTQNIAWAWGGQVGPATLKIELLLNHATVFLITSGTPSGWQGSTGPARGTGSFTWTIPNDLPAASTYQIRITSNLSNTSIVDASDAYFSIN